ncbi:MAG: hypothetical protein ACTSUQ_01505, partial [Candidatus Freyarchaeota archaeon]
GAPQGGWAQAEGKFKYQGDQFRPVDRVVFDEYVHVLENGHDPHINLTNRIWYQNPVKLTEKSSKYIKRNKKQKLYNKAIGS